MANSFSYKETKTTTMKVCGYYNAAVKTITDENDVERSIAVLLSEFDGAPIEISVKVKNETELDEPRDFSEEE